MMLAGTSVGFLVSLYLIDFDWMIIFLYAFFMAYLLAE
jgi:hypothetical protein